MRWRPLARDSRDGWNRAWFYAQMVVSMMDLGIIGFIACAHNLEVQDRLRHLPSAARGISDAVYDQRQGYAGRGTSF